MTAEIRSRIVRFLAGSVLAVLVIYPLSFGPACWISERTESDGKILSSVYGPLMRVAFRNQTIADLTVRYMMCGVRRNSEFLLNSEHRTVRWTYIRFSNSPPAVEPPNEFFERPDPGGLGFGGSMGGR